MELRHCIHDPLLLPLYSDDLRTLGGLDAMNAGLVFAFELAVQSSRVTPEQAHQSPVTWKVAESLWTAQCTDVALEKGEIIPAHIGMTGCRFYLVSIESAQYSINSG